MSSTAAFRHFGLLCTPVTDMRSFTWGILLRFLCHLLCSHSCTYTHFPHRTGSATVNVTRAQSPRLWQYMCPNGCTNGSSFRTAQAQRAVCPHSLMSLERPTQGGAARGSAHRGLGTGTALMPRNARSPPSQKGNKGGKPPSDEAPPPPSYGWMFGRQNARPQPPKS